MIRRLLLSLGIRGRKRQHPSRCRLEVESLEDRNLLSFQVLGTLGTSVTLPTGTAFRINDFEPGAINFTGDVVYGDDLGTANDPNTFIGEGVFLRKSNGQETVLASSTAPAPGGGTFASSFLGPATLNDQGDAAVVFLLQPGGAPFGVNAGAFRYSHTSQTVTAVVLPGVTPAPGGGKFAGTFFGPSLDSQGDLFFTGIVKTNKGVHIPGEHYVGLGLGVFEADLAGHIISIVSPGDRAPGGGTFDAAGEYAAQSWVNGRGDVTFVGHVAGEEATVPGFPPQSDFISTLGSVYVKSGTTGQITSIAHAGDPAPGGGFFRQGLFPGINDRGDVVFTGDLTPAPDANQSLGVFLYSGGRIIPIARPGDAMPGGGHFVTASVVNGNTHLNNQGDVVFNAALDTDRNHDGIKDTGLFQWSNGKLSLIARSGTVLPGVGTVKDFTFNVIVTPPPPIVVPNSGADNNDRGQVLFGATLEDGRSVMLLYTPTDRSSSGGALLAAPSGSGSLPAGVSTNTAASSRPAAATGRAQLLDATMAALLASTVAPPAVGTSATLTVQRAPSTGSSSAPLAGRDNGSVPGPASQFLMRLAGALPQRTVDAVFADLGTNPLGDSFGNVAL